LKQQQQEHQHGSEVRLLANFFVLQRSKDKLGWAGWPEQLGMCVWLLVSLLYLDLAAGKLYFITLPTPGSALLPYFIALTACEFPISVNQADSYN
jgi:hypothetical protein